MVSITGIFAQEIVFEFDEQIANASPAQYRFSISQKKYSYSTLGIH
jgi:hypothetical protein